MKIFYVQSVAKNGRLEPIGPIIHRVMADLERRASPNLRGQALEDVEDMLNIGIVSPRFALEVLLEQDSHDMD